METERLEFQGPTWPRWSQALFELRTCQEARLRVIRLLRRASKAIDGKRVRTWLKQEFGKARLEGFESALPTMVKAAAVLGQLGDLTVEVWSGWTKDVEAEGGETPFHEDRFVSMLRDIETGVRELVRARPVLAMCDGLLDRDFQLDGHRGASGHEAFVSFVIELQNKIAAVALGDLVRTDRSGRRAPQTGRDEPADWDDLEPDDVQILLSLACGDKQAKEIARDMKCGDGHIRKRMMDLKKWDLVTRRGRAYSLTSKGRKWALELDVE